VHGVYKQTLRVNWNLKATSIVGAQFLQTKRAAKLGPQSDLKLGCTVFTNKDCGSTGTSKRPQSPVHSFYKQNVRLNWDLKATSNLDARFLQTEIAAQLEPQSDLNRRCTVFAARYCDLRN